MISPKDVYHVLSATVPLYVTMILAYISVKWWKLFTPDQCSGINKFVAKFSIPLLSFQVISNNNPYQMNLKLILSDTLQKLLAFLVFAAFTKLTSRGNSGWLITGCSLSTLPNTLVLGIPLLGAMYGDEASKLLAQIVVLQSIVWYSILLFMLEFKAAEAIAETLPIETTSTPDTGQPEELEAQIGGQSKREGRGSKSQMPRWNKTKIILLTVWRRLIRNPNTYSSVVGLIWAIICFRWRIKLPAILDKSVRILSTGGLGMAMFSLGLFMASQSSIIACGTRMMILAMVIRFIWGPSLMAVSSFTIGLRGTLLRVAIVQAALPQGIVSFVFAKEYDVHPEILSTGVVFGMLIAMPIALAYYILLGL